MQNNIFSTVTVAATLKILLRMLVHSLQYIWCLIWPCNLNIKYLKNYRLYILSWMDVYYKVNIWWLWWLKSELWYTRFLIFWLSKRCVIDGCDSVSFRANEGGRERRGKAVTKAWGKKTAMSLYLGPACVILLWRSFSHLRNMDVWGAEN